MRDRLIFGAQPDALDISCGVLLPCLIGADYAHFLSCLFLFCGKAVDFRNHPFHLALDNRKVCLRRIMFVAHARCLRTHMAVLRKDSRIDTHGSKHFFQHLFVVIARAENRRNLLCKIDDSGFEADLGVSSVDDTVNFVPKILDHMLGFRRARPA